MMGELLVTGTLWVNVSRVLPLLTFTNVKNPTEETTRKETRKKQTEKRKRKRTKTEKKEKKQKMFKTF